VVKIDTGMASRSPRESVAMITHTTYLGHSQMLGAAVFLDRVMPPQILFRFNGCRPQKIPWQHYDELVAKLKDFDEKISEALIGHSAALTTPELPCDVSVVFLESRRIRLRWQQQNLVLTPAEFTQAVQVLEATHTKARPIVRRMVEKAELLKESGFFTALTNWGGFALFMLLAAFDMLLLVSMLFQPALYLPWTALSIFLALWLLLLRPDWSHKVLPALLDYVNEQFLADLANLRLPRKSIEFFLIIFMGIVYMLCFGGEAAKYIFEFYKGVYMP